jgi:hypothetical protein
VTALRMPRIPTVPRPLRPALCPPRDPTTQDWMARNAINEDDVVLSAWSVFLLMAILGIAAATALLIALGSLESLAGIVVAVVTPFLASSWISNRPSRIAKRESLSYLRHAPSVIGAMAMSMTVSPSLERAVVFASRSSHNPLGRRLAHASWGVLTRSWPDVESALSDLASSLGQTNLALRQSLYLFMASTHEPTKAGMEQLMERAHEISVQGLKDSAERYVASLSTPVMVIFGLGILLPIMLLSIVPMFTLTTPFPNGATVVEPASPPLVPMAFLILVVIPLGCLMYCRSLLDSSPMAEFTELNLDLHLSDLLPWLLWLVVLIGFVLLVPVEGSPYLTLMIISIPPSFIIWLKKGKGSRGIHDSESDFIIGLYQLGNRLSAGASLEKAMAESAEIRSLKGFADWCSQVLHRAGVSRQSLEVAMRNIDPAPDRPLFAEAFQTVAECAHSDGIAAGRIAVRLAKSLGQIRDCENGVKQQMRGVVDMMRSTSLIFAPIVLGVTVGLFGITTSFSGNTEATDFVTLLAGIYVIELVFVVTYLTTFIVENKGWGQLANAFAKRVPMAMMAFISVSLVSHVGFAQWW